MVFTRVYPAVCVFHLLTQYSVQVKVSVGHHSLAKKLDLSLKTIRFLELITVLDKVSLYVETIRMAPKEKYLKI